MVRRLRGHGGGIAGLRWLIGQHREAVEYDLIALGLRLDWLGTRALSWRDLHVIVSQRARTSAVERALDPDAEWGLTEHLLALVLDAQNTLAWMQSEDGAKGRNRPKPTPRPGVEPEGTRFGNASRSVTEIEAWLAKRNPAQHRGRADA